MATTAETIEKKTWTTWEELLLACAVKRHGLKDWDSVAMELQNRTSVPLLLTAQICRNKYHDLKRRFMEKPDGERNDNRTGDEVGDSIPWLEELRKLRVAELQQEVHRCDLSIQSLQLKVKILEEERQRSLKEDENDDEKPDLANDSKEERLENDKQGGHGTPDKISPEDGAGKSASGDDSDRDNRSFSESNSTENRDAGEKAEEREPEPVEACAVKPDPDSKTVGEESYNDSSETIAKHVASKPNLDKKIDGDSSGLRDSAAESKEGTKESSDVQSSASLTKKRRRRGEVSGGGSGGDEPVVSPATTIKRELVKSEPLVGFLDIIKSHKHGSVFERRLESQKTDKYKNMVRQHVDLETVQTRIEDGSYSSCSNKFYVDMLLLFNNAIVFFPKASTESVAAYHLRDFVLKELKKMRTPLPDASPEHAAISLQPKPDPDRSDALLAKHTSSVSIVVCRKRSSISAKASSTNKADQKQTDEKPVLNPKPAVKTSNEEESSMKLHEEQRPVTGARSMRRSSKGRTNSTTHSRNHSNTNSSSNHGSADKGEAPKSEKKKAEVTTTSKKRGAGAADFLKRIKKNSPAKGTLLETLKRPAADEGNGGGSSKRDQQKKRLDERKDVHGTMRRSGGGKQVKEESSPSKRSVGRPPKRREAAPAKRGREGGEADAASKRPKKRSRR